MASNGFVKSRRGILQHLRTGKITHEQFAAFEIILHEADPATGIWWGSANALAGNYNYSKRSARHLLEQLERSGYIKRFATVGGRSNYPILVDKYEPTLGVKVGLRLNALLTEDWRRPAYESCQVGGQVRGQVRGEVDQVTPLSHSDIDPPEKEKEKGPHKKRGGHPLFQPILDYAFRAYEERHHHKPSWTPKDDFRALRDLLRASPQLSLEEFQTVFQNYLDSTVPFYQQKGWRLKYACTDFDGLRSGAKHPRGGKTDAKTRTARNVAAARKFLSDDRPLDGDIRGSLRPGSKP
ncbi:hypothetical protein LCGC14_3021290 [marine sediment metagenome]|uniref:Uncharacterized protein n=1 Tax=marine sediment metagenome TaxID=412755 RepID=A0A0F8Z2R2_9ZZZZ